MAQYIDKSALVTEIKRKKKSVGPAHFVEETYEDGYYRGLTEALVTIESIEVKEIDLVILSKRKNDIMKANELMTGAFVYFNCFDGSKIVVRVTGFMDGIVYGNSENGSHWCTIDKVEPIHITSEILKKNGFLANRHIYPYPYYEYENKEDKLKIGFAFPKGDKTSYKDPWVHIDSERIFVEHLPCIYVHQLQQAMCFCGIEIML